MGCPVCGRRWRAFKPFGGRPNAQCRRCGALERHRALWLLLRDEVTGRVLDIAPDRALERRLRGLDGVEYVSGDLERTDVDVRLDVTRMPFEDASWDVVLCSHVLEHVVDDAAAISELRRILRPRGRAYIMVPLVPGLTESIEDPTATTPAQRLARFGQPDHVRIYAADDLTRRLRRSFEQVEVVVPGEPFDRIWVCSDAA